MNNRLNDKDEAAKGQHKKYCIVTGANSGIGKEITRGLMEGGAHVVMGCRNMQACEATRSELSSLQLPGSCSCGQVDLEDWGSVRRFAEEQKRLLVQQEAGRQLDVLVNNAGVMGVADSPIHGDRHLRANHLGPYLLTRLLLPAMGRGSRIVTVSSRAHYNGRLEVEGGAITQHPRHWLWQYSRSKLCNVLFTAELQRRLQPRGVTCYAVSPGLVATSIFRYFPQPLRWLMQPLQPLLFRTPRQGAATALHAATSPDLEGVNVLFMHDCKPRQPSAAAQDADLAGRLWEASEAMVGLRELPGGSDE